MFPSLEGNKQQIFPCQRGNNRESFPVRREIFKFFGQAWSFRTTNPQRIKVIEGGQGGREIETGGGEGSIRGGGQAKGLK